MTASMPVTSQPTTSVRTRRRSSTVVPTEMARRDALAAYPHVARCATCCDYAAAVPSRFTVTTVVSATLAHHDAGHRVDILATASQHFAVDD